MKLTFPIDWNAGWRDVDGELLPDLAPHLAHVATFALNKGHGADAYWWFVSNLETGRRISYSTKKTVAIEASRKLLATKTPDQMRAAYRKLVKKVAHLRAELS